MNILFVCNKNKHRSKTAEVIFKNEFNTKSAGLFNGKILSVGDLKWANIIFVMRRIPKRRNCKKISKRIPI